MITRVTKAFSFEAAHQLAWHAGACKNLHGHSYRLEVTVAGDLDHNGIVIDFSDLSEMVQTAVIDVFDHTYLNDLLPNPTAELIAADIWRRLTDAGAAVDRIVLWETQNSRVELRVSGAVVVLSGGLDSTVCLADAVRDHAPVLALTVDYGQRHRVELDRAAAVARHFGVEQLVQRLDLSAWGGSALTDDALSVPSAAEAATGHGIPVTYVPGRNLVFLSLAVAFAEARGCATVVIGVNALDYSGYPDCRPAFVHSFNATAQLALRDDVSVTMPLVEMSKADIVRRGIELGAPLHLTWSCYRGDVTPCDDCDACALRAKGFAEAGVVDPARNPRG